MKEIKTITYEAFGGTIFKDRKSCKEYEARYIPYEDAVEFMKADGTICPLSEYASDCAICYIIDAEKALELFDSPVFDDLTTPADSTWGLLKDNKYWVYTEENGGWLPAEHFQQLYEILKIIFEY